MTTGTSFRKAPVKSWQKEHGVRGELARSNPEEAVRKYGYEKAIMTTKTEKKHVFVKPLHPYWKKVLLQ